MGAPMPPTIPDHILDIVSETAKNFIQNKSHKLLQGYPQHMHDGILQSSTHHLVDTAARRALHRTILENRVQHLSDERPDRGEILYVVGPYGAGKSTLLSAFDERIAQEHNGCDSGVYIDEPLEKVYQVYKNIKPNLVNSDFEYYKTVLPEYDPAQSNYSIVRAEASGLDFALSALAKELRAPLLLEQCNSQIDHFLQQYPYDVNITLLGVTADIQDNAERLRHRNELTGNHIPAPQLADAIYNFSTPGRFVGESKKTGLAVLAFLKPDTGYKTIFSREKGVVSFRNDAAMQAFERPHAIGKDILSMKVKEVMEPPPVLSPPDPSPGF